MRCGRSSPDSSQQYSTGLRDAQSAVRALSMLGAILLACVVLGLAFASGCGRVVMVDEQDPVRLGQPIRTRIYFLDPVTGEWVRSDNEIDLGEGMYVVSPSYVEDR